MPPIVALLACLTFSGWMIRQNFQRRPALSRAIWIPMLWVMVLGSRPTSMWLSGFVDASGSYSDGSPIDRNFYLIAMISGFVVLSRRRLNWRVLIRNNKGLFAFYGYLFVTVLWAYSPFTSFKRCFKDFGCVVMALVILTEDDPAEAFKAIFVSCAYLFIPLSECFIRYFPNLGRIYTVGGALEVTGVTCQKNSLGALVLICSLVLLWDLLQRRQSGISGDKKELLGEIAIVLLGLKVLNTCDSKTSIVCLAIGAVVLLFPVMPALRRHTKHLAVYTPILVLAALGLNAAFGIKDAALQGLGRDPTLTGRTEIWEVLLSQHTNPIYGTGFYSFWDTPYYRDKMPVWMPRSAHNGFLEAYMEGGYIEIFFLTIMIFAAWRKIHAKLRVGDSAAVMRFSLVLVCLMSNLSESGFARLGLVWLCFIFATLYDSNGIRSAEFGASSAAEYESPIANPQDGDLVLDPGV